MTAEFTTATASASRPLPRKARAISPDLLAVTTAARAVMVDRLDAD
ncbi:hypothetical protein [Streptomyces olivochromogenes]|nr:hypothetical protein [Streptomyces olivochromogenes]